MEYLLKNERYMGDAIVQKRYRTPTIPTTLRINHGELPMYHIHGCHEPIVPKEVFEQAQRLLAQRAVHTDRGEGGSVSLKMECPDCGNQFRRMKIRNT